MSEQRPHVTLICDAFGCGYNELAHIDKALIGKPCPKCGKNLLTQEDYDATVAIVVVGEALGVVKLVEPGSATEGIHQINYHAGKLSVTPS